MLRNDNPDNIIVESWSEDLQSVRQFGNGHFKLGQYKFAIMAYKRCLQKIEKPSTEKSDSKNKIENSLADQQNLAKELKDQLNI